jgi:hypothetical protein
MKKELIDKLEALLRTEDIHALAIEVRSIQREYEALLEKEIESAKQLFLDEGGVARDFEYRKQAEDIRMEALFQEFRAIKKDHEKKQQEEQSANLEIKRGIIAKIRSLANIQSQPGKALKELKLLQAQWKETGSVSTHVYKELQNDYSKSIESFYYSLDIYRELEEHDFKKNLELKSAIIEKLRQLKENTAIKETERLIKVYRNEWEEVGPVQHEKWEHLKAEWKVALDDLYAKLKTHYNELEELKKKNLASKSALLDQARLLIETLPSTEEDWKKNTDAVILLQKEWKSTGPAEKDKSDEIWKNFREVCDRFFEAKNVFYAGIKEERSVHRKQKLTLISKAETLSTSTDWKETTERLIQLQAEWKRTPSTGPHEEPRLFHRFRKACNHFFDAKKKHFESQDAAMAGEVKAREELLASFCALTLNGSVENDKETINGFITRWNAGGNIPPRDRKRLNDAFYKQLDEFYVKLGISETELEIVRFKNKLERLQKDESAEELLQKEYDHVKKHAEEIHLGILKYENNLGFFKTTKGDNPLLKDINDKIKAEKEKLLATKQKQKMIGEILRQVQA